MNQAGTPDPGSDTTRRAFRFVSAWTFPAPADRVWAEMLRLLDSDDPFAWWPAVRTSGRGDDELHVRVSHPLGLSLHVRLHGVEVGPGSQRRFSADGDLLGGGSVVVESVDGASRVVSTWEVDPVVGWLRRTSRVLRPFHVLAHGLVMRRARAHLERWLRAQGVLPVSRPRQGRS